MQQKNRNLLQIIGEKLREIDPYVWINYTFRKADVALNQKVPVVVSDMRKIEEYSVGMHKGYVPIRVVCDRDTAIQRIIKRDGFCDESLLDKPVETGTRDIQMLEIDNNGTIEDLYKQIDELIKWMEENINEKIPHAL